MLWQSSLVFQERISHTHVKSMPCFRHGSGCVSSLGLVMIRFERYLILQEKYHVLWLLFFFPLRILPQVMLLLYFTLRLFFFKERQLSSSACLA